jgi:hypothetical protein
MRALRRLTLVAVVVSLAMPVPSQAVVGNAHVTADDLYVRTRWDSWMIGTLYRNQRFDIQGSSNGYYWGYADGAFNGCGWVGSAYVTRDNAGSAPSCGAPRDLGDPHCGAGCYSATASGDKWHVTCTDATVFGNYRVGDLRSPRGTIYAGQEYNWRYTTADRRAASIHWNGISVFVLRSCVAPGPAPPPPPNWSGWENLGCCIASDPDVASWGSTRLDVFGQGTDNALYHKWWDGTGWSGWENLGCCIASGPGAVSRGSGHIDVFGQGTDNALYHKWYPTQ